MKITELSNFGNSGTALKFATNPIRRFIFWAARPFFAGILDESETRFSELHRGLDLRFDSSETRLSESRTEITHILNSLNVASQSMESTQRLAHAGQMDQEALAFRLATMEKLLAETVEGLDQVRALAQSNRQAAPSGVPFADIFMGESYAQLGEDRILRFLFDAIGRGTSELTYIDIGAAYPAGHNNTFLFYTLGGRGVLVEPDPAYLPAYNLVRPRDAVEQVAIVPERMTGERSLQFHRMTDRGWSTVSESHVEKAIALGKSGKSDEVFEVKVASINQLLERHCADGSLDILSIDIEGLDQEVINELDFSRFHPKAIIVENNYNISKKTFEKTSETILVKAGYRLFASTFVNSIFVREECLSQLSI